MERIPFLGESELRCPTYGDLDEACIFAGADFLDDPTGSFLYDSVSGAWMTLDLEDIGGLESVRGVLNPFDPGFGEEERKDLGDTALGGNVYGKRAGV